MYDFQGKMLKFDFGLGSAQDLMEELTALPRRPLAVFKGAYFYREGTGERKRWGNKRGGEEERGREGGGEGMCPPIQISGYVTACSGHAVCTSLL